MVLEPDVLQAKLGPRVPLRGLIRYGDVLASRGCRLTGFLVHISQVANRPAFVADEAAVMRQHGLDEAEQALIRARDYAGLLRAGAHVYAVAKAGHVFGATLLDIGAGLRGQTTAEFMAWRRARNAPALGH